MNSNERHLVVLVDHDDGDPRRVARAVVDRPSKGEPLDPRSQLPGQPRNNNSFAPGDDKVSELLTGDAADVAALVR